MTAPTAAGLRLPFVKVQGLGNDFVLVDQPHAAQVDPPLARQLCHRNFGVGADGVLLVLPGDEGDVRMRILNADGSLAEMCGNGIRCFARHVALERGLAGDELRVDTDAGLKTCVLRRAAAGEVTAVRVAMGPPRLAPAQIPLAPGAGSVERTYEVAGRRLAGRAVSMGNPHLVLFVEETSRALAEQVGPALVRHPDFPAGTNVELAAVRDRRHIDVVVYERGVGITLACGTGACATAVAACLAGHTDWAVPLELRLLGGPALVEVAADLSEVWLEGPAVEVFRGVWGG
jgi:diaminopimelate epimerase